MKNKRGQAKEFIIYNCLGYFSLKENKIKNNENNKVNQINKTNINLKIEDHEKNKKT